VRKKNLSGQQELTFTQAETDPKQLATGSKFSFEMLNAEKPGITDAIVETASTHYRNPRNTLE